MKPSSSPTDDDDDNDDDDNDDGSGGGGNGNSNSNSKSGLSSGGAAAIGVVFGLLGCAGVAFGFYYFNKKNKDASLLATALNTSGNRN